MKWDIDKTLIILCSGIAFFGALVILCEIFWPNDSQLYTLFSTAFGNFSGALMLHLRPSEKVTQPAGSTTATVTQTEQVVSVPLEKSRENA